MLSTEAIGHGAGVEVVQEKLFALSPKNDAQRWLQSTALQITRDIEAARWSILEQIGNNIQWPFLVVVVFWLAIIFTSFGLSAPRNASWRCSSPRCPWLARSVLSSRWTSRIADWSRSPAHRSEPAWLSSAVNGSNPAARTLSLPDSDQACGF